MVLDVPKGKYVVAVSGGVDSVVLLKMLVSQVPSPKSHLIVAHFDHGIRPDSHADALFVKSLSDKYGLAYVEERAELGEHASEETARDARYDFLRRIMHEHNAMAIITAHHQDDLIETIALHILRGTGRQGLTPMMSTVNIMRPLINVPKSDIIAYAKEHTLQWREDSTNQSTMYTRNAIRQKLQTQMTKEQRQKIIDIYQRALQTNSEIELLLNEIEAYIEPEKNVIMRTRFVTLPYSVARECMTYYLKRHDIYDYDRKKIEALVIGAKTLLVGKKIDINNAYWLASEKTSIKILRK